MRILALALVSVLLSTPAVAQNSVSFDQDVVYYHVRGMTEETIARSLRRDAPRDIDGFQGQTNFLFSWTYNYDQVSSRQSERPTCLISNARVEIKIVVTLPRHRTIERAPDDVEATWTRFAEALEEHEMNHAEDFARIGRQIPDALDGLTGPCPSISQIANKTGMDYVDRAQKAADDYDAETNHGETEGTFFPGI